AFRTVLFEVGRFRAVDELDRAATLHLDSVLSDRRGYCLSLSAVALVVAERVGAPLFGVAVPNHFFVRYDDGELRRNLELTREGAPLDEADVAALIGELVDDDAIYGRNLGAAEVTAILLHNRGHVALVEERYGAAERDLRAAIAALPGLPEAHRNLGVLLAETGRLEAAEAAFEEALRLHPGDVDALVNRALLEDRRGDRAAAVGSLKLVRAIAPGHARAGELLAEWVGEGTVDPSALRPGLRATFFRGTRFDEAVATRVDRELDFDWQNGAPARGVPRDRFSARWEGYLRAPKDGLYTLFVVANDGGRVVIDDHVVAESWRDLGTDNWYGTADVELDEGFHPIRIEQYDRTGGARLLLRVGVEGVEKPLDQRRIFFHSPD
ncbi:MAG: PA14 domain-containing protein, partial [Planctomycetota bacterium JB042]